MGVAKRMLDDQKCMDDAATEILKRARAIIWCEDCDAFVDNFDPDALIRAYKIANDMITRNHKLVVVFNGDRKALIELIDSVYADVDSCRCT